MSNIYGLVKIYGDINEADCPEFIIFSWRGSLSEGKHEASEEPQTKRDGTGEGAGKIVYPVVLLLRPLTCCETREVDLWQATSYPSLVSVPSPRRGCLALPVRFAPAYAHPKKRKITPVPRANQERVEVHSIAIYLR